MNRWAHAVNNGSPITINDFGTGPGKSLRLVSQREFSLHHFSNRVFLICGQSLLTFEGQQFTLPYPQRNLVLAAIGFLKHEYSDTVAIMKRPLCYFRGFTEIGNWSGISIESWIRPQNQGIPGQFGAIEMLKELHECILWLTL